jgi:hypothetical protein
MLYNPDSVQTKELRKKFSSYDLLHSILPVKLLDYSDMLEAILFCEEEFGWETRISYSSIPDKNELLLADTYSKRTKGFVYLFRVFGERAKKRYKDYLLDKKKRSFQ